jgi:plastocyanin
VRNDWGIWRTTRGTLERMSAVPDTVVAARATQLLEHWNGIRFGPAARVRAAVGDRVRWYDEPEEI